MKLRTLSLTLATALLATATGATWAATTTTTATPAPQNNGKVTDLIKKLTDNQVNIVQTFPAVGNLTGVIIAPKDSAQAQQSVLYVDNDGRYVISGALITADGVNQTEVDGKKYIGSKIAQSALKDIKSTAWIQEGSDKAKHMIYVVADPNCIYCNKFYQATRDEVKSGDLAIRWVWVGFLKPSSKDIAQAIIAAKDPIKAMSDNESTFNNQSEQGGLAPLANPDKTVTAKFTNNMKFLEKYQFPGTPVIIYTDNQGEAQASFGLPTNDQLKALLASATAAK